MEKNKGVVLVVGAGAGLGGAVARRFARDGYTVCATRRYLERLDGLVEDGRRVYVHRAKGRGRSATLVAGWLMKYQNMSFEEARDFMVSKRKLVKLEPRHGVSLKAWLAQGRDI